MWWDSNIRFESVQFLPKLDFPKFLLEFLGLSPHASEMRVIKGNICRADSGLNSVLYGRGVNDSNRLFEDFQTNGLVPFKIKGEKDIFLDALCEIVGFCKQINCKRGTYIVPANICMEIPGKLGEISNIRNRESFVVICPINSENYLLGPIVREDFGFGTFNCACLYDNDFETFHSLNKAMEIVEAINTDEGINYNAQIVSFRLY